MTIAFVGHDCAASKMLSISSVLSGLTTDLLSESNVKVEGATARQVAAPIQVSRSTFILYFPT